MDWNFYKGKKVFITGNTGFKGSWMCQVLLELGADIYGYALRSQQTLYDILGLDAKVKSVYGDIRDLENLKAWMDKVQPEIVIHMAAQPLVRESYENPVDTYAINVMGTVNVLEAVRCTPSVQSVVNVTTDKVYKNREWLWGYREDEELNGYDPYSNSKSCSELVTSSYINSFFRDKGIAVSTARAGNVIGGGDFAKDRIIPDCIRAAEEGKEIIVRNPYSTRPYQHVLEPVLAYLMIAMKQYQDRSYAGTYNVGPDGRDCFETANIVSLFCDEWEKQTGKEINWISKGDNGPHEANFLKLDCSKLKSRFGWRPVWNVVHAIAKIVEWQQAYDDGSGVEACMVHQIQEYIMAMNKESER